MFDFSWSNILHSNVINFAIMLALFAFIISKLNVMQKIEDMRFSIQRKVEESDAIKAEAKNDYEKVEASLKNIDEELNEIVQNAQQTAVAIEHKAKDDLNKSVETIKFNTEKLVKSEENRIQAQLMKKIAQSSVEAAQKQIKNALKNDKELHRKFIEKCIEDIEKLDV